MPRTADTAATRIVHSNVTGMNAGQLFSGLPPTFSGYATAAAQYCSAIAADASDQAADQNDQRQPRMRQAQRFGQLLDRERRIGIHPPVARRGAPCGRRRPGRSDRRTPPSSRTLGRRLHAHIARRSSSTLALRQTRAHLEDRNHRQESHEQRTAATGTIRSCRRTSPSPRSSGSTCPTTTAGNRGAGW